MNNRKNFLVLLSFLFIVILFSNLKIKAEKIPPLTNEDCIKCHPSIVFQFRKEGEKHRKLKCIGCHKGHPPLVPKNKVIPKCSECHKGKPHFKLKDCTKCHNPHAPLKMDFKGKSYKKECLTCHTKIGREMNLHPSKHAKLACTYCHIKHKYIPSCLKCHTPHASWQTSADCLKCHPAHTPSFITYDINLPNKYCGACHKNIQRILEHNKTKHSKLTCAFCHRGRHGIIPQCEACHGVPHPQSMMRRYKNCLSCHKDAHNLVE